MISCEACGEGFRRRRGYVTHGRQSKRVDCQEAYLDYVRADRNPSENQEPPEESITGDYAMLDLDADDFEDLTPAPFAGDFFGTASDYTGEHFGQEDVEVAEMPAAMPPNDKDLGSSRRNADDLLSEEFLEEARPGDIGEEELVFEQEGDWEPSRDPSPDGSTAAVPIEGDASATDESEADAEIVADLSKAH
ncbi:hypothetical protein NP233_g9841 [Leucocoprinus birnbaumii]|uniref:Uncharacterized protein n=1 Tax=Leucocoprinus birnbaumii TaxID=56174 RepID=A0AAD5VLE6_9AGAR|nr:hypothetical protein NP233_g9841 [Leucocoprinus birnbaumii]